MTRTFSSWETYTLYMYKFEATQRFGAHRASMCRTSTLALSMWYAYFACNRVYPKTDQPWNISSTAKSPWNTSSTGKSPWNTFIQGFLNHRIRHPRGCGCPCMRLHTHTHTHTHTRTHIHTHAPTHARRYTYTSIDKVSHTHACKQNSAL